MNYNEIQNAMKPSLFIGSSVERLDLAYAAQENLEHDVEPTVWTQGVFKISNSSLQSLIGRLDVSDFGLFIFAPDDVVTMRSIQKSTIRDNVIFELGLFIGRLGSNRCFIVVPRDADELHLPSDLLGVNPGSYNDKRQDNNLNAALGPACNQIRERIRVIGSIEKVASTATKPGTIQSASLISNGPDCVAVIRSLFNQQSREQSLQAMRMREFDAKLGLSPGSFKKHLKEAVDPLGYEIDQMGEEVVLLDEKITF